MRYVPFFKSVSAGLAQPKPAFVPFAVVHTYSGSVLNETGRSCMTHTPTKLQFQMNFCSKINPDIQHDYQLLGLQG